MRNFPSLDRPRIPLFFKLWFAFVALLAVSVFASFAYVAMTIAGDPSSVGRFVGQIVSGYSEATK